MVGAQHVRHFAEHSEHSLDSLNSGASWQVVDVQRALRVSQLVIRRQWLYATKLAAVITQLQLAAHPYGRLQYGRISGQSIDFVEREYGGQRHEAEWVLGHLGQQVRVLPQVGIGEVVLHLAHQCFKCDGGGGVEWVG